VCKVQVAQFLYESSNASKCLKKQTPQVSTSVAKIVTKF